MSRQTSHFTERQQRTVFILKECGLSRTTEIQEGTASIVKQPKSNSRCQVG